MNYTILTSAYTPNNRQLDLLLDEYGNPSFALYIDKGTLCRDNKVIPFYVHPQAEIIFCENIGDLLMIDAGRVNELDDYDIHHDITLYTTNEYDRKLNGYTPVALNKQSERLTI